MKKVFFILALIFTLTITPLAIAGGGGDSGDSGESSEEGDGSDETAVQDSPYDFDAYLRWKAQQAQKPEPQVIIKEVIKEIEVPVVVDPAERG